MGVSEEKVKVQYCRFLKDCRPCASMGSCLISLKKSGRVFGFYTQVQYSFDDDSRDHN